MLDYYNTLFLVQEFCEEEEKARAGYKLPQIQFGNMTWHAKGAFTPSCTKERSQVT